MATEGRHIAGKIERNVRHLIGELRGVSDTDLNRALDIQPSNTLYQLGFHTLGSARYWSITLAGGEDFYRDRPAEFVSSGPGGPLIADLGQLIDRLHAQLDPLDLTQLDGPVTESATYRPADTDGDRLVLRDSLLHALEHTALHLGHAQITRQLLGYEPVRPD